MPLRWGSQLLLKNGFTFSDIEKLEENQIGHVETYASRFADHYFIYKSGEERDRLESRLHLDRCNSSINNQQYITAVSILHDMVISDKQRRDITIRSVIGAVGATIFYFCLCA